MVTIKQVMARRGGTNRENLCRVGYRVRKLSSGPAPGRGLPDAGRINLSIFSASFKGMCRVVANRLIWRRFPELWHCAHEENGTVNIE